MKIDLQVKHGGDNSYNIRLKRPWLLKKVFGEYLGTIYYYGDNNYRCHYNDMCAEIIVEDNMTFIKGRICDERNGENKESES